MNLNNKAFIVTLLLLSAPLSLLADPDYSATGSIILFVIIAGIIGVISLFINLISMIGISVKKNKFWYFMAGLCLAIDFVWLLLFMFILLSPVPGIDAGSHSHELAYYGLAVFGLIGFIIYFISVLKNKTEK